MKKLVLTLFIITLSTQLTVAQNVKRANHLFEKRAYIEAAELYLNEEVKTQEIQEKLGDCYYFNNDMTNAVKWYRLTLKMYENSTNPIYFYRYSQALKGIQNFEDADKWYQKYQNKKQLISNNTIATLPYFESLNSNIKRPYIVHSLNLNSEGSDFGVSLLGNKIVFASTRNNGDLYEWNKQPYLDLFEANIDDNFNVSNITAFSKNINTKMHESNAIFTADGKTMYFTRNNFKDGKKGKDEHKVTHLKIYKAELINNEWTNITELPFNSDNYSTEHPALSPNEKQLYFASDMPGSYGSFDLYVVDINSDGSYSSPKNLGNKINTEQREQFPFISSKNILYFSSDGHLGLGGLDIFKSEITNNSYSKPINLSNIINSSADDFAFIIDENSETGYFSSNRKNGKGDDDIYRFTQVQQYFIEGVVKDKKSLQLLANTEVSLFDENNKTINTITVGPNATYSFEIETNKNYSLKGTKKLYNPTEIAFSTDSKGNIDKDILLLLEAYEDAEKDIVVNNGKTQIKINPIYFDFNKWNIRSDAALELNNIVEMLKKYPNMVIEIGAHTDCRGPEEYNLNLSHKRAKSVREYLVSQGISNTNVKSVGYGETQPLNKCVKEGICKEEEYNINRRCEFVILN
jgi:outer membrane protein OmpA-like peptidoglycan-associated protein